jgi:hypothetical protein
MTAEIGAYHARTQKEKSLRNKIERSKRGVPCCGMLPFGRSYDRKTGKWDVVEAQRAALLDIVQRYLKGESLTKLAGEHRLNYSTLTKILRERCGTVWECRFRADDLGIDETVTMEIPRLLPEQTIRAVHQRLDANRTYLHGAPHSDYLLSGHVFCAHCGYPLHGAFHRGYTYYRHGHRNGAKDCPLRPRPWVRADDLERSVVDELFKMFGNRGAIERAVKAAIPDADKLEKDRRRVADRLAQLGKARATVLNLIEKEALTEEQAADKLYTLKAEEAKLNAERDDLDARLADVPDQDSWSGAVGRVYVEEAEKPGDPILVYDDAGQFFPWMGNDLAGFLTMHWSSRGVKDLVECAFGTLRPGQPPPGVYVTPTGGRQYGPKSVSYELRGNLSWRVTQNVLSRGKGTLAREGIDPRIVHSRRACPSRRGHA